MSKFIQLLNLAVVSCFCLSSAGGLATLLSSFFVLPPEKEKKRTRFEQIEIVHSVSFRTAKAKTDWLDDDMATTRIPELKLILCGEYGAGKSSIFRRFTNNTFVASNDRSSTLGLDHFSKVYRCNEKESKV